MASWQCVLVLFLFPMTAVFELVQGGRQEFNVHWNISNPIFRIDNTAHVMDVELHDQVHIVCPSGRQDEQYIIYNVNREDYETCRVSDPNPRILAVCNRPNQKVVFTITFRAFSPTPRNMEFQPGKDYFFISTSGPSDINLRQGGRCRTHNMKVIFKVKDKKAKTTTKRPKNIKKTITRFNFENEVIKQEASRMQSSVSSVAKRGLNSKVIGLSASLSTTFLWLLLL